MTESQRWRDRFAKWEAQELKKFPLPPTLSALEESQYEIALKFFQRQFPVLGISDKEEMEPPFHLDRPHLVRADTPTRQAFFEYFGSERPIDVFCLHKKRKYRLARLGNSSALPYLLWDHGFTSFLDAPKPFLNRILGSVPLPAHLPPEDVYVCSSGCYSGPLSASGDESIWHWNGERLIHLSQYGSSWIS